MLEFFCLNMRWLPTQEEVLEVFAKNTRRFPRLSKEEFDSPRVSDEVLPAHANFSIDTNRRLHLRRILRTVTRYYQVSATQILELLASRPVRTAEERVKQRPALYQLLSFPAVVTQPNVGLTSWIWGPKRTNRRIEAWAQALLDRLSGCASKVTYQIKDFRPVYRAWAEEFGGKAALAFALVLPKDMPSGTTDEGMTQQEALIRRLGASAAEISYQGDTILSGVLDGLKFRISAYLAWFERRALSAIGKQRLREYRLRMLELEDEDPLQEKDEALGMRLNALLLADREPDDAEDENDEEGEEDDEELLEDGSGDENRVEADGEEEEQDPNRVVYSRKPGSHTSGHRRTAFSRSTEY
ncbi:hypothetical protein QFC21_007162 [Naganishia friedmannii]|uniref:Uncharacterized protein n=1 Tax=Naganishia friedmannii TaxID=89922 RepID=A0ACC2UZ42_9TREE|nr:hypothetical protein QFC21_007162 [Naganishia friedmannii]